MATTKNETYLYLEFGLENGKTVTIKLKDPKEDLDGEDVKAVMDAFVEQEAIKVGTSFANSVSDAYTKTTSTVDISLPAGA